MATVGDIQATLRVFEPGRARTSRGASFDFCYNHFQGRRQDPSSWERPGAVEASCIQLGFYLASWGMYRGSSFLLQRSAAHLEDAVTVIAKTHEDLWAIDVPDYDNDNIVAVLGLGKDLRDALSVVGRKPPTDVLITKVLLGVFGNVPAFDRFYIDGVRAHVAWRPGVTSFKKPGLMFGKEFYQANAAELDATVTNTIDFEGNETTVRYPIAKLVDMYFWQKGLAVS